ncbi:MAG TPA: hypothetical protein VE944_25380, partial [Nostoc sp.]|uniref:hypothetical protein n=1 Tax=Nostoc sp. TaxID=1180 RepID=UPI002D61B927
MLKADDGNAIAGALPSLRPRVGASVPCAEIITDRTPELSRSQNQVNPNDSNINKPSLEINASRQFTPWLYEQNL